MASLGTFRSVCDAVGGTQVAAGVILRAGTAKKRPSLPQVSNRPASHILFLTRRNKLEPLGRPRQHGTALPPGLGTEQAFGLAVHARELERANQGKKVCPCLSSWSKD